MEHLRSLAYSRISSEYPRFILDPTALMMTRSAMAMRPCFPITFPRSLWATLNSKTVDSAPSIV